MIRGVHTMFYTSQPENLRNFLRDALGFSGTDVGEGWLIFDLPEADMGVHPSDTPDSAPSGTPSISFYCDDIEKTVVELKGRGVEFTGPIENHGYGLVTFFRMPGDFAAQLYQPLYAKPERKPAVKAVRRTKAKRAKTKPRKARKTPKARKARR